MSHFAVAVFTDKNTSVDDLLEPYSESLVVEKYLSKTKSELLQQAREYMEDYKNSVYAEYAKDPEEYLQTRCLGDRDSRHFIYISTEFMDRYNESDEEVLEREYENYDDDMIDTDGNVYSTHNPNSKWDWYDIGGRFHGRLRSLKEGGKFDELPTEDIDFLEMHKFDMESLQSYEDAISGGFYSEQYMKQLYPTREIYEKIQTTFWTRAVVTPDGEWHELGEMGWFGLSSEKPEETVQWVEKYYENFIKPAIEYGWDIHVVDCHI